MEKRLRVGVVAGEASGDILGAGLIKELRRKYPNIEFTGIGGPAMIAEGCISMVPMEKLSVMGLIEVIKHLPELLKIRRRLINHFLQNPPDIFIGIDAPDFCLPVERRLRKSGIKTIHYVSPSVWAWRKKRVFKIKDSVDRVLCIFPFEKEFYDEYQVPATFVGHTLADKMPVIPDQAGARRALGIDPDKVCVTLMPGSRRSEIERLGSLFFTAAQQVQSQRPDIEFLIPVTSQARADQVKELLSRFKLSNVHVGVGQSHHMMAATNAILMSSGTATLEGMLLKKPMVVSYLMSPITWWLVKKMVSIRWASLPNLLANEELVPEFLQEKARPDDLAVAVNKALDEKQSDALIKRFEELHLLLKQSADQQAASAVLELALQ